VHGDWIVGAWGVAGLISGIAIGLLDAGPIGWVGGGLVAAFFAIFPGLFKKTHDPGKIGQTDKISQWRMFGDQDHTGNEVCRANHATYHGNPNCTYKAHAIRRPMNVRANPLTFCRNCCIRPRHHVQCPTFDEL